ncbi:MAG: hypothetical protein LBJ92_02950 [Holosporales bacterium]|jgi:hypothetical protein|nr:hypothetical protein [Holosporales bacterium]
MAREMVDGENLEKKEKASAKPGSRKRFYGKSLYTYLFNACLSFACAFFFLKVWTDQHDRELQTITEKCNSLESKIKVTADSLADIMNSIDSIKEDLKTDKENSSYIYTSIASLQKDIEHIKTEINIKNEESEEELAKALLPEKMEFITSFENLVKDGAPFNNFITANAEKIDMKKYRSNNEIMKFSEITVKPISALKKMFASVSMATFDTIIEESFWEKQKRIIKESILGAFRFGNSKKDGDTLSSETDDKSRFKAAANAFDEGNLEESIDLLSQLRTENDELNTLISDFRKRIELDKAFKTFKDEFLETESKT